jgi:hypothetical protein
MKLAVFAVVLGLAANRPLQGQGTFVCRNDFTSQLSGVLAQVRWSDPTAGLVPVPASSGRVQVSDLAEHILSDPATPEGSPFSGDGLFDLGTLTVPDVLPGSPATVVIRAWIAGHPGQAYAESATRGTVTSTILSLGGDGRPPATLAMDSRFAGMRLTTLPAPPPQPVGGLINVNNNFLPPGKTEKAFLLGCDGQPLPREYGRVEVTDAGGILLEGRRTELAFRSALTAFSFSARSPSRGRFRAAAVLSSFGRGIHGSARRFPPRA